MVSRLAGTGLMQGTANSIMRREGPGGLIEAGELWTKSPSALDLFLTFKHEARRGSVRRVSYVSQPILEKNIIHCRAGYVCPGSLACVPTPADCPCPYPERDEGEGPPFICTRGDLGCDEVVKFSKPI
ncbi:hypothetical protein I317_07573 [Kwoniella heveanensis CBS 569]|nr:hypothetical protein I317_07573 [Kwoniella heveanensis CBS 569]